MEDPDRRKRFLEEMKTADLRYMHWLVSRELAARGEEVSLVMRPPVEPELGTWGRPRTSMWLPGLRWAMFRRNLTAAEVARRAGLGGQTVADAMAGRHRTRIGSARRIAEVLGVELEELRRPPLEAQVLEASCAPPQDDRDAGGRGAA